MRRLLLILLLLCLVAMPTAATQAQGGDWKTHVVQAGENLYRISLKYGVSMAAIQAANPSLTNPNLIFVGQVLRIPPAGTVVPTPVPATKAPSNNPTPVPSTGGTYVVQRGDTLSRVASRFGTTVAALAQLNGIVNPSLIFVGQVLKLPGGSTNPNPNPNPGVPTPVPPVSGTFELGGHVFDLNSNTQAVMRSAKMVWVKRQIQSGDGNGPALIQQAHAAGFKILFGVLGDKGQVLNPSYQDGYANYVGSLAQAGADAIEVWNEMNLDREWPTGQINAASYVQLLSKAYSAVKRANPNTLVVTGAPSPTGAEGAFPGQVVNDDRYYAAMAQAGAARFADCIGVHYNEGIVSPAQTSGDPRGDNYPTRYFQSMLNRALASFPGKQACFTELGYLSPEGYGPLPQNFSWAGNTTANQQAQWLGEAVRRARASGRVRMLIVWNIDATQYTPDPQAGYAIIRPGNICIACATIAAAMP